MFANENQEPQNRGVVNPGHALDSVDGASLYQELENVLSFVERGVHALQGFLPRFLERLAALAALIPLIVLVIDSRWLHRSWRLVARTRAGCDRCDFAQLIKVYAQAPLEEQRRYSPPDVTYAERVPVMGDPDPAKICTSHVERQNLTIRMQMRRLTRLTNAFSKKWENLRAVYCVHFAWYNFARRCQALRMTPAMAAGITNHMWTMRELLEAACMR